MELLGEVGGCLRDYPSILRANRIFHQPRLTAMFPQGFTTGENPHKCDNSETTPILDITLKPFSRYLI
jgi:hypothetical protein